MFQWIIGFQLGPWHGMGRPQINSQKKFSVEGNGVGVQKTNQGVWDCYRKFSGKTIKTSMLRREGGHQKFYCEGEGQDL